MAISCKKASDESETVTDVDGNVYKTVIIGTQTWLAENLRTTKYNDGIQIPLVADGASWAALTTPGYCWYDNNTANKSIYGGLYNWYVVNTGKLCPAGWHVPTDPEFMVLVDFLGSHLMAGGKLKEKGTSHWLSPNTDATNESGFTALPGGARSGDNGYFAEIGTGAHFWTNSSFNEADAQYIGLSNTAGVVYRTNSNKGNAFSVRCLKD